MNGSHWHQRTKTQSKKGRTVALKPRTVQEIVVLEDDLAEVVSELRKIRVKMTEEGLEAAELETEKAEGFVRYLKDEWVGKCAARVKMAASRKQARLTRERIQAGKVKSK